MSLFKRKILYTRELMQELSPRYVRGKVLDLGAGKTKYRPIFEEHASEYVSCDTFEAPHIDHVEDAEHLSYDDESFDTVICTMVFEHVQRPWVVAAEIERILKPGGHCIVTAPFMFPYHQDPEDYFRFSTAGMASLFPHLETVEAAKYGGSAALVESCWRMAYCSPYKKGHSFLRRNIYRVIRIFFEGIDRRMPPPKDIYCNVYFVGKKQG